MCASTFFRSFHPPPPPPPMSMIQGSTTPPRVGLFYAVPTLCSSLQFTWTLGRGSEQLRVKPVLLPPSTTFPLLAAPEAPFVELGCPHPPVSPLVCYGPPRLAPILSCSPPATTNVRALSAIHASNRLLFPTTQFAAPFFSSGNAACCHPTKQRKLPLLDKVFILRSKQV